MSLTLTGVNLTVPDGKLTTRSLSANAEIASTQLAQKVLQRHPVPFTSMRVWDAFASLAVSTAATDDLALITGTFGTDSLKLQTGDLKAAGATSRKVGFELEVPANYDDSETFQIRIRAGMETTVSDTTATVDLEVYKPDGDGAVGSDLCTTAAQSANSLTFANLDFTVDGTAIDPGDRLLCVITFAVNDAATGTAVTGTITDVSRLCDTRG